MQCILRGYSGLVPLKKNCVRRRDFDARSVTSRRVQIFILRIGDARLSAKIKARHGDAMRRIGMRGNGESACFVDEPIRREHIGRRADFARADIQFFGRDMQIEQEMFQFADGRFRGENAENVKAERGGQFKTGEHENFFAQAAKFVELFFFFVGEPVAAFQQFEVFDFVDVAPIARRSVVVGDGNNVEPFLFRLFQNVEIRNIGLPDSPPMREYEDANPSASTAVNLFYLIVFYVVAR